MTNPGAPEALLEADKVAVLNRPDGAPTDRVIDQKQVHLSFEVNEVAVDKVVQVSRQPGLNRRYGASAFPLVTSGA